MFRLWLQCPCVLRALITLLLIANYFCPSARAAQKPNVLLICVDDLKPVLGCYGDKLVKSPNIDRLAAQGCRFTDAHSPAALCSPTRYGLLTGRYAWRTRLQKFVLLSYDRPLIEPGRMTVATLLKQSGYATAWIGKWHVGLEWSTKDGSPAEDTIDRAAPGKTDTKRQQNIDFTKPVRGGPTSLGFDYFFGTSACCTSDPPYCFIENDRPVTIPTRMTPEEWRGQPGFVPGPMADDWSQTDCDFTLTRKAIEFVDRHLDKQPFFLVLSTNSPHNPFLVPDAMKGKSQAGPRGDLVTVVDWAVGQIDGHLAKRGLVNETLFIVTSDNGCSPSADYPKLATFGHNPSAIYRGHKADIFDGGHRVPFIVRWPGQVKPGTSSNEVVQLADMLATFAGIMNEKVPPGNGEDSYDIRPALFKDKLAKPIREATVVHNADGVFAIRQGQWRAVRPKAGQPWELYDVSTDPSETKDLAAAQPAILGKLTALAEKAHEPAREGTFASTVLHERDQKTGRSHAVQGKATKPKSKK